VRRAAEVKAAEEARRLAKARAAEEALRAAETRAAEAAQPYSATDVDGRQHKLSPVSQQAPPDLPFRWTVIIGDRKRGAISLVAYTPGPCDARPRVRDHASAGYAFPLVLP